MDEVALEEKSATMNVRRNTTSNSSGNDNEDMDCSSPELPWCVLCNKDAKYRCIDCSGDLYCSECNIEVHKNWGDTDHQVVEYKQK